MGYRELEEICRAALTRKDLDPLDRKIWRERLSWVQTQRREADHGD